MAGDLAKGYVARALTQLNIDVWDAALGRIRWLWDEFDGHISVSISGGKDSVVVMELAAIVARERGQKLKVHFLDQEAEWQGTHDYLRELKDTRDDIEFDWYQIPFRLFNSASFAGQWGSMWQENEDDSFFVRPPERDAIRINDFGQDRFAKVLHEINRREGGVHLTGMRVEESPTRRLGSTTRPAYKWATWGAGNPHGDPKEPGSFWLMHPIYDWSYRDIWTAIEQNGWKYNRIYDLQFQRGVPPRNMRVSSLVHEHALAGLGMVQEIEPETWEALVRRFPGINAYGHVGDDILAEFRTKRPYMFDSWAEYLDYLIENLVLDKQAQQRFYNMRDNAAKELPWMPMERISQCLLTFVMKNDHWTSSGFGKWVVSNKQWAGEVLRMTGKTVAESFDWASQRGIGLSPELAIATIAIEKDLEKMDAGDIGE